MSESNLDVSIVTPHGVLFEGKAQSVILPGEKGVFEVLSNHKALLSRLVAGQIFVDEQVIPVRRGCAKVVLNRVLVITEAATHE